MDIFNYLEETKANSVLHLKDVLKSILLYRTHTTNPRKSDLLLGQSSSSFFLL